MYPRKTRILLIDTSRTLDDSKREKYDVHQPPVGLLALQASALASDIGKHIEIEVLDSTVDYETFEEIQDRILDYRPDIIGLRCLHVHTDQFHAIARFAKTVAKVPVVFGGGPYINADGFNIMESDEYLDLACIGEGEATFVAVVEAYHHSRSLSGLPGTVYRSNGEVITAPTRELIQDLDTIPIPDWTQVDWDKYGKIQSMPPVLRRVAPMVTSRGCPYRCTYCHDTFKKKLRLRSPAHVVAELKLLDSLGVKDISIIDDIFNIDKKRVIEIFDLVQKENLKMNFYYPNGLRGDQMPNEVIDAMVDGGSVLFTYALESANARIQKMIKKDLHLDRLRDAMHYTAERGVMLDVFCMTGFPTETFEEAKETVDFLNEFDGICFAYLNVLNVFPGTEIYDQVQEMEGMGGTEAFSTGYQGHGMDQPHVDVTRNYFITKFMMRKNRVKKALSVQRKFLTDDELLSKYKSYCGKNFKLDSADDIEKRLAVY